MVNFFEMIVSISIIWKKHHSFFDVHFLFYHHFLHQMYNTNTFFKFDLNSFIIQKLFFKPHRKKNNRGLNPTTLSELTSIQEKQFLNLIPY